MDKYVACTTKKQWEAVLKKFDEDGYKWRAGNSVMSGLCYFSDYGVDSVLHVYTELKKLGYCNKEYYRGKTFISAHDFLKGPKTKPIVISRNGRVVTAEDKNTGEKGVATCSPSDEFDFKVGAKLALARLWGEEISEKPSDDSDAYFTDEIKVGNRVKIRDWDDMEEEFGLDCWGHINSPLTFNPAMKKYCGKIAVITRVDEADGSFNVSDDNAWWFDKNMIVKPKKSEPKFKVGDFVRTRKDAVAGEMYENLTLLKGMITECAEVVSVEKRPYASYVYETKDGYAYTGSMLEKYEDDDEIREGDIVEVTNPRDCYDTYTAWIVKNIASVELAAKFVYHHIPKTDTKYRVIKIASHTCNSKLKLAYIQDQTWNDCFIMNLSALKKVKK